MVEVEVEGKGKEIIEKGRKKGAKEQKEERLKVSADWDSGLFKVF